MVNMLTANHKEALFKRYLNESEADTFFKETQSSLIKEVAKRIHTDIPDFLEDIVSTIMKKENPEHYMGLNLFADNLLSDYKN